MYYETLYMLNVAKKGKVRCKVSKSRCCQAPSHCKISGRELFICSYLQEGLFPCISFLFLKMQKMSSLQIWTNVLKMFCIYVQHVLWDTLYVEETVGVSRTIFHAHPYANAIQWDAQMCMVHLAMRTVMLRMMLRHPLRYEKLIKLVCCSKY